MNPVAATPAPCPPDPVASEPTATGRIVTFTLAAVGAGTGTLLSATGVGAVIGAPLLAASMAAGVEAYRKTNLEFTAVGTLKAAGAGALVAATAGAVALVATPVLGVGAAAFAGGTAGGVTNHALSEDSEGSYIKSALIGGVTGGAAHGIGYCLQGIKEGARGLTRVFVASTVGGATSGGVKVIENFCEGKNPSENVLMSIASGAVIASAIDVTQQLNSPSGFSSPTPWPIDPDKEFISAFKEAPKRLENPLGPGIENRPVKEFVGHPQRTIDTANPQGRRDPVSIPGEKLTSVLRSSTFKSTLIESKGSTRTFIISTEQINQFACLTIDPIIDYNRFYDELWNDLDKRITSITGPQLSIRYYIHGKQVNCTKLKWKHLIADEFIEGKVIVIYNRNNFFALQKSPDFDFKDLLLSAQNKTKNMLENPSRPLDPRFDSFDYPDDEM
jgi:hypothetical protein